MSRPESFVEFCPVPTEQQPIYEYEQLKESGFFAWATLPRSQYLQKIAWLCFWAWLLVSPFAWASFPGKKALPQVFLAGNLAVEVILALLLLRLYLGWVYIGDRLKSAKVFYEESGWYDGQTWTKTPEILQRDQLIVTYQINPILARLKQSFLVLALVFLATTLLWFLLF
jgi:hypothetical protein